MIIYPPAVFLPECTQGIYAIEFSLSQGAFHIDLFNSIISKNRQNAMRGLGDNDYKIIDFASDVIEANRKAEMWRQVIESKMTVVEGKKNYSP